MPGASGAESKAVCSEAGMFALRERRIHVTQEDFELAAAKVMKKDTDKDLALKLRKWLIFNILTFVQSRAGVPFGNFKNRFASSMSSFGSYLAQ